MILSPDMDKVRFIVSEFGSTMEDVRRSRVLGKDTAALRAACVVLYRCGWSTTRIAQALKKHNHTTILYHLRMAGIPADKSHPATRAKRLRELALEAAA